MLASLQLENFRKHISDQIEFGGGLNVIVGPNGCGKTTIIEALEILLTGTRIRGSLSGAADLITKGQKQSRLCLAGESDNDSFKIVALMSGNRIERNSLLGEPRIRTCTFLPDMALNIRGAPARRRGMLDRVTQGTQAGAPDNARRYNHALQQRNNLIRRARTAGVQAVSSHADQWGEQMMTFGELVRQARVKTVDETAANLRKYFKDLAGEGELRCSITESPAHLAELTKGISEAELRRGTTATGPHLDKINFELNGQDLRECGSNGEQRLAMISWVFAEADIVAKSTGHEVLVMLDDPLAELDTGRRERLLNFAAKTTRQTLITTPSITEPEKMSQSISKLIEINNVVPEATAL